MNTPLTIEDLDASVKDKVYTQRYESKPTIDGLKIIELKEMSGEDSDFSELMRLNATGESLQFPGFHIQQINRSTQIPGSVKAWHLHLSQDEIWYVPDDSRLLTAMWDVRANSPTKGVIMRIPMGGGTRRMVFIPHGVAHGSANLTMETAVIIYFMNNQFDSKNPDEHRIPWDANGTDFWSPQRD
jgi:dTDP-4-dehydrorhamnose 3,5-epimerase